MSGCCNEPNCRRSKPMMLMRSELTGTWYIVTAYTELGNGVCRASTKHRLPDNAQDQLEDMRDGHAAAARADRLCDEIETGQHIDGCEGDPTCPACISRDLRAALDSGSTP